MKQDFYPFFIPKIQNNSICIYETAYGYDEIPNPNGYEVIELDRKDYSIISRNILDAKDIVHNF